MTVCQSAEHSRQGQFCQTQQVYSLGFRIEDLVEEPASLRAREAPLPRPFDDGALGGNVTAAAGVQCFTHHQEFCISPALYAMPIVQVSA